MNVKPLLIHIGDDYWKVMINWFEYEFNFNLIYNLYVSDNLILQEANINKKEFIKFIKNI